MKETSIMLTFTLANGAKLFAESPLADAQLGHLTPDQFWGYHLRPALQRLDQIAKEHGHELLLDVPWEPRGQRVAFTATFTAPEQCVGCGLRDKEWAVAELSGQWCVFECRKCRARQVVNITDREVAAETERA